MLNYESSCDLKYCKEKTNFQYTFADEIKTFQGFVASDNLDVLHFDTVIKGKKNECARKVTVIFNKQLDIFSIFET